MLIKRLFVATFTLVFLLLSQLSYAQGKIITGTVTDSKDGMPLQGVTVSVKGTTVATQTNASGAYSLNVPVSANTLVFTSVGFVTQELLITGNEVDAALISTTTAMENVVVVAYGTRKKSDLTGSVTAVTAKDFQKGSINSSEQLLQGKVPGLEVTTGG
ncbi:MAG TPA: carboxypeptidase-like regulatory domain-containing protein, partial [Niabella sp.]|nr:carboxypeptidase-like regulatory domain-containing protein [Niabella sp.]